MTHNKKEWMFSPHCTNSTVALILEKKLNFCEAMDKWRRCYIIVWRLIGSNIWKAINTEDWLVTIFGNVIAMGGGKKGDIKILGLKKISQYMAKQRCRNDLGAWIDEPAILLSSKSVFLKEPHTVVFFSNIVFPATQDTGQPTYYCNAH